jgi:hypothetical protein
MWWRALMQMVGMMMKSSTRDGVVELQYSLKVCETLYDIRERMIHRLMNTVHGISW